MTCRGKSFPHKQVYSRSVYSILYTRLANQHHVQVGGGFRRAGGVGWVVDPGNGGPVVTPHG